MSLLRQLPRIAPVRSLHTAAVLSNAASRAPAPVPQDSTQQRDLAAEQLQRHDVPVAADQVSSAPCKFASDSFCPFLN